MADKISWIPLESNPDVSLVVHFERAYLIIICFELDKFTGDDNYFLFTGSQQGNTSFSPESLQREVTLREII